VIRHSGVRRAALERVASAFASQGATIMGAMASPLLGPAGNAEFLLHVRVRATPAGAPSSPDALAAMLDAAVADAPDVAVADAPEDR
jgi:23S rRNA (cytidine1920-2'-O)/16S rRNA (cytidine1409-2'-O)-methyltransferase